MVNSRKLILIVLVGVSCLLFLSAGGRASAVELDYVSPSRTVSPRGTATLAFRVTNQQSTPDTFVLEFSLPDGFSLLYSPTTVSLAGGEEKLVLISLVVGSTVPAGSYKLTLQVTSETDPSQSAKEGTTITVEQLSAVEIRLPPGRQSFPGQEVEYDLTIVNRGNYTDTFEIEVDSHYSANISQDVVELPPGGRASLRLTVYIPEKARPGARGHCTVRVSSRNDPTVSKKETVETFIGPPPPEAVEGSLFPIIRGEMTGTSKWWGGDTFSSKVDWRLFGGTSEGTYIDIDGKFDLGPVGGMGLENGRVKYIRPDWRLTVGNIETPGEISTDTVNFDYRYTPEGSPYSLRYYRNSNTSFYEFLWTKSDFSSNIKLANGDIIVSGSISPGVKGLSLSGKVTHSPDTNKIRFSPSWGPLGGKFVLKSSEFIEKVKLAPQLSLSLADDWKLKTKLDYEQRNGESLDTTKTETSFSLSNSGSPLTGSLTTIFTSLTDQMASTEINTMTMDGKGTLRFGTGWTLSLDMTLAQQLDGQAELTNSFEIGLGIPIRGESMGGDLDLSFGDNQETTATLSVSAQGTSLEISKSKSSFSLSLGTQFETPAPFTKKTKGRIEGIVFIDENLDGSPDPGEKRPSGLSLKANSKRAVTGEDGRFRFYPQSPGSYQLEITNLPEAYSVDPDLLRVKLRAGETKNLQIQLVPAASLAGQVLVYQAVNGLNDNNTEKYAVDHSLVGAEVLISNGRVTHRVRTDFNGAFYFQGLYPGDWTVRVKLPDISPPHYVEQEIYRIQLASDEHRELKIRVLPKEREVRPLNTG